MMTKSYEWILFDADDTLFHFDAFSGLKKLFTQYQITFTKEDFSTFQQINKPLWVQYQNGFITQNELKHQRFLTWSQRLNVSTEQLNQGFISTMANLCEPLEGAIDLLNALNGNVKMGIITNGFIDMQETRLTRTGLKKHFDLLIISEEVGLAKPDPAIFLHAFEKMGQPALNRTLMVGDTLESDIVGGINAGIDTCWLNRQNQSLPATIRPHYEVTSLKALQQLLGY